MKLDISMKPVAHYIRGKVYNSNICCIDSGILRAIAYSNRHRIPLVIHNDDGNVIAEIPPQPTIELKGA